jgi:hypothetical protein
MRFEFFDRDGVEHVRIVVGADIIERVATKEDHDVADVENAAEDTQLKQVEAATKERIERENENEKRTQEQFTSERTRLDAERHAKDFGDKPNPAAGEPLQAQIEQEFDKGLAAELGDDEDNGKKHKTRKHAE